VRNDVLVPDFMPVLSRGKHRRGGASGGCFMEFASYLAGERWSDHPRCTHPLLAALARAVNDCTTDAGRPRLVSLIPSVVGLTTDSVRADVLIALRSSRTALPVVSADWANVMAVALLGAERFLAALDGRAADDMLPASRLALSRAPGAERWAREFVRRIGPVEVRDFGKTVGASTVRQAVVAIAQAATDDPDQVLYELLSGAITDCAGVAAVAGAESSTSSPAAGSPVLARSSGR
jgi:hypothetical protein